MKTIILITFLAISSLCFANDISTFRVNSENIYDGTSWSGWKEIQRAVLISIDAEKIVLRSANGSIVHHVLDFEIDKHTQEELKISFLTVTIEGLEIIVTLSSNEDGTFISFSPLSSSPLRIRMFYVRKVS
jgi:hypothetical protein